MNFVNEIILNENIKKAYENFIDINEIITTHEDLPFPFIPATTSYFRQQFYWDSFFIMQGLKHIDGGENIILGMIENFFVMIDKYGYIPNSYNKYDSRSQPPFLSSMVLLGYEINQDKIWLEKAYMYIKKEYEKTWMNNLKITPIGLSKYSDNSDPYNVIDKSYGAMQECGWDNTLRFGGFINDENKTYVHESKTHLICPIDLNSLLYKYEKDLEYIAGILKLNEEKIKWENAASNRKKLVNKYMWSEKEEFYFDYDIEKDEKTSFLSLGAYFTMWSGIADDIQANKMIKKLNVFEKDGGLACTEAKGMSKGIQWGYPNGWAPLHFITINGLKNYDFQEDAARITKKWLENCAINFIETNRWDEKLSVDSLYKRVDDARYAHQSCTAWTVFLFKYFYETIKLENQILIQRKTNNLNTNELLKEK